MNSLGNTPTKIHLLSRTNGSLRQKKDSFRCYSNKVFGIFLGFRVMKPVKKCHEGNEFRFNKISQLFYSFLAHNQNFYVNLTPSSIKPIVNACTQSYFSAEMQNDHLHLELEDEFNVMHKLDYMTRNTGDFYHNQPTRRIITTSPIIKKNMDMCKAGLRHNWSIDVSFFSVRIIKK